MLLNFHPKILKSLAESCGEKALQEVARVKEMSKDEAAKMQERVEKDREELERKVNARCDEAQSQVWNKGCSRAGKDVDTAAP